MHDGLSFTLEEAIGRHRGQADGVRLNDDALSSSEKLALIAFLNSFRRSAGRRGKQRNTADDDGDTVGVWPPSAVRSVARASTRVPSTVRFVTCGSRARGPTRHRRRHVPCRRLAPGV